jgi:hypothetical protein
MNVSGDDSSILPRHGLVVPSGDPFAPAAYADDFDALEIFNGKRRELIRTQHVPDPLPPPPLPTTPAPKPGDVIRLSDGSVAYPGAVDDWFHLLNRGYRYTAVADSDSHGNTYEEPGYPRSYVRLGVDDPFKIRDLDVARAIKAHAVTMTNGPFVELFLGDQPMGGQLSGVSSATFRVRVRKAPWVHVEQLNVYVNGALAGSYALDDSADTTVSDTLSFARDSYVVAEVTGAKTSLWPIVTGLEEPPLTIADVIGTLGDAFGIPSNPLGNLRVNLVTAVFPYAITNPIWVDVEGDGVWTPPGNTPPPAIARETSRPYPGSAPGDIRALFRAFDHGD